MGNIERPLGRPRHRYEDNIKMDPKETFWEGVDSFVLAQDSHTGCEQGNKSSVFVKRREFLVWLRKD